MFHPALTPDAPLDRHNSFRVPARAVWLAEIENPDHIPEILDLPQTRNLPRLILGAGSNVLFTRDFPGLVLTLRNRDIKVLADDAKTVLVHVEAGVRWHDLVTWTLERDLCGLENLALIPGLVGAAPIQNIGAYGAEISDVLETVEVFDCQAGQGRRLDREACRFGYRRSQFQKEPDRWVIIAIELKLSRKAPLRIDYPGIREELAALQADPPTARSVAEAVIRLRRRKLPDPAEIGNAGSFFKNPILTPEHGQLLRDRFPELPVFESPLGKKVSAAWLIERGGWKGFREGDAGVSPQHALVLVNYGTATGAQIWSLAQRIQDSIRADFGLELDVEPRIL
jgi:UDP-N-acetylmuramate dehydrogenase